MLAHLFLFLSMCNLNDASQNGIGYVKCQNFPSNKSEHQLQGITSVPIGDISVAAKEFISMIFFLVNILQE